MTAQVISFDTARQRKTAPPQAPQRRQARKMAAVLALDVISFSYMMETEPERVIRLIQTSKRTNDKIIRRHGGRIANTAGDSIIAVFPHPAQAVAAAIAINERNILDGADQGYRKDQFPFHYRIGVHYGPVIFQDDGDVLGATVNVAARLEQASNPLAITVSPTVFKKLPQSLKAVPHRKRHEVPLKGMGKAAVLYSFLDWHEEEESPGEARPTWQEAPALLKVLGGLAVVGAASVLASAGYMAYLLLN